jgi:hypothetical protein
MTLLYGGFSDLRNDKMPLYFFGLPDDLASPEATEELANDAEARQVAQIIANELSRDRYDGEEIEVLVFNDSGQLIHQVWTRPHDAGVGTKQTLFPEHVHPRGCYQSDHGGRNRGGGTNCT